MRLRGYTRVFALALACAGLFGQTVGSSLVGTVVDPKGASVADAPVTLTSASTGAVRYTSTDSRGMYSFPDIAADTYNVAIKAPGFKAQLETGIVVLAQEHHSAGKAVLQAGSVAEYNVVPAGGQSLQAGDSAEASTIGGSTLEDITLKGRDMFGFLKLIPGVVDTNPSRDVTTSSAIAGITINGNPSAFNFNVDGVTTMDTGTNQNVDVEPNIDSIQEIRVLSLDYRAEYGRNAGGIVTVITKSGGQQFHGSGAWNHRNQEFNANSWANNSAGSSRAAYRFNVETYGIGGPVYIPKVANVDKKKLFFFFSQERTAQYVPAPNQYTYMPTADELVGNFSQTFTNVNGNPVSVPVLDPANNNTQFPANTIPSSRLNYIGQTLLGFFPTPNFTPVLTNQLYVINYLAQGSQQHPRLNNVLRFDSPVTSKVSVSFRWLSDRDNFSQLFVGVPFSDYTGSAALTQNISPILHKNPGHGYAGTITDAISSSLVNDFSAAQSWTQNGYYTTDSYASEAATLEPSLPTLFTVPTSSSNGVVSATNGYNDLLPTFVFGGAGLPSSAYYTRNSATAGAAEDFNNYYTLTDNVTKTLARHTFKAGFYGERNTRIQPAGQNYNGDYSFAANSAFPFLNTNDGYANAVLGDVASYSQYTGTTTSNVLYYNVEFYAQDSWRVNRRLTVDFGIRFYHQTPPTDHDGTFVNFVPADYNRSAMSRLYYPYCSDAPATCTSAANGLVARDGLTGATVGAGYIGDIVYGSGNPDTGLLQLNKSVAPYQQASLAYGPRAGVAFDVFGDGTTVVRGGWGIYHNRLPGSSVYGLAGQQPAVYQQSVNNVTFAQIAAADVGQTPPALTNVTIAPASPNAWPSSVPYEGVGSAGADIQRILDRNTTVDLGYALTYSFDQYLTYDMNYIPIGTSWPFKSSNLNPTTSGSISSDIGSIFERSLYPGYGAINTAAFLGSSNYNALTARVNRRIWHNLALDAAYTWSKALGVTTYSPEVANNISYNYGRLATDRNQNLQVTWVYGLPNLGQKLSLPKVGYLVDHWQLSGIASVQSGAPFDPTCSVTSGQPAPASYTGTPDLTARCNVVGNPLAGVASSGNGKVFFNASAFALPALATGPNNSIVGSPVLGNLGGGAGVLTLPRVTNVDMTLTKNISLGDKIVLKLQVQAYNVFNHTEISAINSAIQFNPTTNAVSNPAGVGYVNATLPNRILAFSARILF